MQVIVFTLIAFALSWGYWGWLLLQGLQVAPGSQVTHLPGLAGPALAALVTASLSGGRTGLRRLVAGLWGRPRDLRLAALVLLAPPVLSLGTILVRSAIQGHPLPSLGAFTAYPGVLSAGSGLAGIVAVVVLNGVGEELGWRGFALDLLADRFGRVWGILVLTAIWATWHLPLFWLNASMATLVGLMSLGWLFSLGCGAFALADLYWSSGRRLWLVALWHVAYNAVVATPATEGMPAALASVFVVVWGIYALRRFHAADRAGRAAQG